MADDGYAIFASVATILALRDRGGGHPRCAILVECCEESGSFDPPHLTGQCPPPTPPEAAETFLTHGISNKAMKKTKPSRWNRVLRVSTSASRMTNP